MTRVKICGITNREDASAAVELGADALGFIFVPDTPRYVGNTPGLIELLDSVPPFVSRVGVCKSPDGIDPDLYNHLDLLQIYDHAKCNLGSAAPRLIPVFRLRSESDLADMGLVLAECTPPAVVLDAYHEQSLGGVGAVFDWSLAVEARAKFGIRIILAGGLTPENVAEAIRRVRPYAVDVSSGVEAETTTPRRKVRARLEDFMHAVCSAS